MAQKKKSRYKERIEEGNYSRIPNEILEAVYKQEFTINQYKVFWFILKKTMGWEKDRAIISLKMFAENINLRQDVICRTLSELQKRRIIGKTAKNIYEIQIDTDKWRLKKKRWILKKEIRNREIENKKALPELEQRGKIGSSAKSIGSSAKKNIRKPIPKAHQGTPKDTILKDKEKKQQQKQETCQDAAVFSFSFSGEERNEIATWFIITPGWEKLGRDTILEQIDIAISKGKKDIKEYFRLWKRTIDRRGKDKPAYLISMVKQGNDPPGYQEHRGGRIL